MGACVESWGQFGGTVGACCPSVTYESVYVIFWRDARFCCHWIITAYFLYSLPMFRQTYTATYRERIFSKYIATIAEQCSSRRLLRRNIGLLMLINQLLVFSNALFNCCSWPVTSVTAVNQGQDCRLRPSISCVTTYCFWVKTETVNRTQVTFENSSLWLTFDWAGHEQYRS